MSALHVYLISSYRGGLDCETTCQFHHIRRIHLATYISQTLQILRSIEFDCWRLTNSIVGVFCLNIDILLDSNIHKMLDRRVNCVVPEFVLIRRCPCKVNIQLRELVSKSSPYPRCVRRTGSGESTWGYALFVALLPYEARNGSMS